MNPRCEPIRVELVEEVHAPRPACRLEYLPQLGRRLPHVLGNQPIEAHLKERHSQLSGQNGRGQRLAGSGRTGQQQLAPRRKTPLHDAPGMALLPNDPLNLTPEILSKDHLSQPGARVRHFQQVRQLATRPPDGDRRPGRQPALGPIDQGAQLVREPPMPAPRLVGCHLHGNGEEPVVVAIGVRLEQRLELFTAGHGDSSSVGPSDSHPEHLHHLVAEVVDDLDGDAAGLRAIERTRHIAVKRRPRVGIDLGLQGGF